MARKKSESPIEADTQLPTPAAAPDAPAKRPRRVAKAEPVTAPEPTTEAKTQNTRGRRSRSRKAEQPVLIDAPTPDSTPEEKSAAASDAKPKRSRRKPATTPSEIPAIVDEAGTFVILEWRPVVRAVAAPEPADATAAEKPSRRRRRGRRRGGGAVEAHDVAEAAEAASDAADLAEFGDDLELHVTFRSSGAVAPREETVASPVERPKRPAMPVRPVVPTPDDAPRVVPINGVPTIVKNHRAYPPILFFGNSSDERRAATVDEEIRMASDAGIHLHVHLIELEVDEEAVDGSANLAAYLLSQTLRTDPDAHVFFRLMFVPPRNWQASYPEAAYTTLDGALADPSICDDAFWGVANRCLETFIRKMRLAPSADRVMGIHLDRAEWFVPEGRGYDTSAGALKKFREWAATRYSDDEVMLRAAWFDGRASFDTLTIPSSDEPHHEGDRFVRASRKQRRYVDYHLFLSDATAARIAELAYTVKATSEGAYLVGVSYGYTFEWSHPASGHLALGKILRTREIDIIGGPPSYRNREPGGSAPFPCPIDSIALNGKLFISEEDFKTKLGADHHEPDDFNPVIRTPQALDGVHWRGAGEALAHAGGVCWMDLWGNGWLKTPAIWSRAGRVAEAMARRLGSPLRDPDVAVFIDERALAYLVDTAAFTFLVQNVRECVLRSGLSAGFFLLSDLSFREKFPEAKLYLFLNAWDIRPELRASIKNRLQQDGKVLFWLYSAGLFDGGRESLERAREVTGIALKPQPFHSKSGTTVLNRRHPLCAAFPDRGLVGGTKLEPSYFAIPEDALVLGEYTQTGLPSFVVKEFGGADPKSNWTSVFLGEPIVSPALIRALGQLAGAHVYDYQEDVVHVNPPFLAVHCGPGGPRTLTLPANWVAYDLQGDEFEEADGSSIRFTAADGQTRNFLIGPQAELENLIAQPLEDLLTVSHLPEVDLNTVGNHAFFDIPIMKLGEWMEADLSDDAAEEWLLRPPVVEVQNGSSEENGEARPGRRRRRRRGQGGADRRGTEEVVTASEQTDDDEFRISVTFRKRE